MIICCKCHDPVFRVTPLKDERGVVIGGICQECLGKKRYSHKPQGVAAKRSHSPEATDIEYHGGRFNQGEW